MLQSSEENGDNLRKLRKAVHAIAAIQFSFAIYYDWNHVIVPSSVNRFSSGYGGKYKFLTNWDAIVQAIFFIVCLLNDVIGTNEINPKSVPLIRKLRDFVFSTLAFPLAMFVGLTFWSLMAIDRELVLPRALDPYFPWWLNHMMHTNIMVFIIIEMVFSFRKYPPRSRGLTGLSVFMCVYLVWTFVIYFKSGEWVYPVMEVLNWGQRILFLAALLSLGNILYLVGEFINNKIWEKELVRLERSKSKKK